jgi:hypothetical protein
VRLGSRKTETSEAPVVPAPTAGSPEAELARITYKPGWRFSIQQADWRGTALAHPELQIVVPYDSVDRPGASVTFCFPIYTPLDKLVDVVWCCVQWIENHEQREHFKVDGAHYVDPHPAQEERAMNEIRQAVGGDSLRCGTCGGWVPGTPSRFR